MRRRTADLQKVVVKCDERAHLIGEGRLKLGEETLKAFLSLTEVYLPRRWTDR